MFFMYATTILSEQDRLLAVHETLDPPHMGVVRCDNHGQGAPFAIFKPYIQWRLGSYEPSFDPTSETQNGNNAHKYVVIVPVAQLLDYVLNADVEEFLTLGDFNMATPGTVLFMPMSSPVANCPCSTHCDTHGYEGPSPQESVNRYLWAHNQPKIVSDGKQMFYDHMTLSLLEFFLPLLTRHVVSSIGPTRPQLAAPYECITDGLQLVRQYQVQEEIREQQATEDRLISARSETEKSLGAFQHVLEDFYGKAHTPRWAMRQKFALQDFSKYLASH